MKGPMPVSAILTGVALVAAALLGAPKRGVGSLAGEFQGVITVSTSASGNSAYVTVAHEPGAAPRTAFALQYQNPMPAVAFQGSGKVIASKDSLDITADRQAFTVQVPFVRRSVAGESKSA